MPNSQTPQHPQTPAPITPSVPATAPVQPVADIDTLVAWGSQKNNFHNVRVLCDLSGLAVDSKNDICACIYQESTFLNYLANGQPVKHENLSAAGVLLSTDWGMCQINDYYHIGAGKDFPTVEHVLADVEAVVQWMIDQYKAGRITEWSSYSSGAYLKWLEPESPMWDLVSN